MPSTSLRTASTFVTRCLWQRIQLHVLRSQWFFMCFLTSHKTHLTLRIALQAGAAVQIMLVKTQFPSSLGLITAQVGGIPEGGLLKFAV